MKTFHLWLRLYYSSALSPWNSKSRFQNKCFHPLARIIKVNYCLVLETNWMNQSGFTGLIAPTVIFVTCVIFKHQFIDIFVFYFTAYQFYHLYKVQDYCMFGNKKLQSNYQCIRPWVALWFLYLCKVRYKRRLHYLLAQVYL